ncbi:MULTISPECIES: transposase [unclassified Mesorhizobium]|uniref:transposase n=1 Tax=unclassified Mesorhizobium TaxID=325217 RepID=UPI0019260E64|nr:MULTISPECIES: transposase [unclassified Mesorhizobium]
MLFGSEHKHTRFLPPLNLTVVVSVPLTAICGRKDSMNFLEGSVARPKQERNEIGEVLVRRQAGELLGQERGDRRHFIPGDSANLLAHLIRHLLDFVSRKDRKAVVPMLSAICRARTPSRHEGSGGLRGRRLGRRYPAITQSWRRDWQHVVPFFAYPSVRSIIYDGCGRNVRGASVISKLRLILVSQVAPDRCG